MAGSVGI